MQFEYTGPQTELEQLLGGYFCINAFGSIEPGDDEKFADFLERTQPPPRTIVYINSTGGFVEAAIAIGRMIRDRWFTTSVGTYQLGPEDPEVPLVRREHRPGKCLSAATLVFLGGRLRYLPEDGEFGVHQFSFRNPTPEYLGRSQILSAKIARYVSDMGISNNFLELSSSVPSAEIHTVDAVRLQALDVVTGGQTDATWTTHARGGMLYVRGERDSLYGHHKVLLCNARGSGFLFWAVIEAQGREEELTKFGLVELVLNGEDTRIDISKRCERFVAGIYVNLFTKLSYDEAKAIAYSRSFGVQIRFSSDAGMFLGIAAMETGGGEEMLQTFFDVLSEPNIRSKRADAED